MKEDEYIEEDELRVTIFTVILGGSLIVVFMTIMINLNYFGLFLLIDLIIWIIFVVACAITASKRKENNEDVVGEVVVGKNDNSKVNNKNTCNRCNLEIQKNTGFCVYCGNELDTQHSTNYDSLELLNIKDVKIEPDAEIGDKGTCERCGTEGEYMYDPYDQDIHDEENLKCYCEDCAREVSEDI